MKDITIGINGLGRMGKLVLWHLIAEEEPVVIVNVGREVGECFYDFISYVTFDSTYGSLKKSLFGAFAWTDVVAKKIKEGLFQFHKTRVLLLRESRNPATIPWGDFGVQVVIEATGKYNYPERPVDYNQDGVVGSVRGHFESDSVKKVLVTSPFKGKITKDAVMRVMGVNDHDYLHTNHNIISNASCSTNCVASAAKLFIDEIGAKNVMFMSIPIGHSETGKQPVLDRLPAAGKSDPCTYRSSKEGTFISSTGAEHAFKIVVPGLDHVPFSAASIRYDSRTVSLAIIHVTFQSVEVYSKKDIGRIFLENCPSHVGFSRERIFSGNILGSPLAAVIDGRNSDILLSSGRFHGFHNAILYSWFDNEWGYVCQLMKNLQDIVDKGI